MNECQNQKYREEILCQKWGKLTPIEFAGYTERNKRTLWKCRCDCGKEVIIRSDCLRAKKASGRVSSCGCSRLNKNGKDSNNWNGFEEISGTKWINIINGAKSRNLEFSITKEYVWNLFLKQDRKCAITKLALEFPKNKKCIGTASLDRIDSSKGYIEKNVWWVHKDINVMKWDFSMKDFYDRCKLVIDNYKQI